MTEDLFPPVCLGMISNEYSKFCSDSCKSTALCTLITLGLGLYLTTWIGVDWVETEKRLAELLGVDLDNFEDLGDD